MMRSVGLVAVSLVALLVSGCSSGAPTVPANTSTSAPTAANGTGTPDPDAAPATSEEPTAPIAEGDLAPPDRAAGAFTYDTALAPEGAHVAVAATAGPGTTRVRLVVEGLVPERGYAAHAHVSPCGATGDVAGPHFQNRPDPAATPGRPSADPAYANPQNEIWLDLRTDQDGNGEATTTVPFVLTGRAPQSVVIHGAETTMTAAGQAGSAGARIACLTVPFPT